MPATSAQREAALRKAARWEQAAAHLTPNGGSTDHESIARAAGDPPNLPYARRLARWGWLKLTGPDMFAPAVRGDQ